MTPPDIATAFADGVLTVDSDGRVSWANDAAAAFLGTTPAPLDGTRVSALGSKTTLDPAAASDFADAVDVVADGTADTQRVILRASADGRLRVAEARLSALPPDANAAVAAVVRERTGRRDGADLVDSLHAVTEQLREADNELAICSTAVHAAAELLDLPYSGIWLHEEERDRLDPVAATAEAHDRLGGLPHFSRNEGLVWESFLLGESAIYDDVSDEPLAHNDDTPLRSELIVPIESHGVLMAASTDVGEFGERDRRLAEILEAHVAAELDRVETSERLTETERALERQRERLSTVETVLSDAAEPALAAGDERIEWFIEGAEELASDGLSLGVRERTDIEATAAKAATSVGAEDISVLVEGSGSVRADPARFQALFERLFRSGRARHRRLTGLESRARQDGDYGEPGALRKESADGGQGAVTFRIGLTDDGDGFYVRDDAPFDVGVALIPEPGGLGTAIARSVAVAHGWEPSLSRSDDGGLRFEVRDVTTLSPE